MPNKADTIMNKCELGFTRVDVIEGESLVALDVNISCMNLKHGVDL